MPLPPAPTKRAALLLRTRTTRRPVPRTDKGDRRASERRTEEAAARGPGRSNCSTATPPGPPAPRRSAIAPDAPRRPLARAEAGRDPGRDAQAASPAPRRRAPQPPARPKRSKASGPAKLFVLDTNVLLHDPMCLFRFEEHDIFLPMIVLEELDGHKKGTTEVARNGRQTSRTLDALARRPGRRHRQGA